MTKVFISKGSAATDEQRTFVDAVLEMLDTVGMSARIMGENEWSHEQPLRAIRKIMKECDGAVIIAFTRTQFDEGIELKKNQITPISNIKLPTTWNHIEASMAYSFDLPLLVVAESGLKSEGLIENGYDWRVYWTDLHPNVVKSDSFKGFLQSWKRAVDEKKQISSSTNVDLSKVSIGKLFSMLTLPQLWSLIAVLATVIALAAGSSYKLGAGKWPWQEEPNKQIQPTQKNGAAD
ncbi:hypothetical protein [Azotobacter chroococcum]|uniref:hypothetical protein n=1 Tax=Azotobacter chroococcum TaxID=353 RepID=UPI0010AE295B|nr:hypothetical protein [Azotobacter chroococcum]TKD38120.1 hypothetical protein FCG41_14875 [Azotobacter chroococcum]